MIEVILRDYLLSAIDGVPVFLDMPKDIPAKYIRLQKTGSRRENRITTATFAIQSVDVTLYAAAVLNETVKAVMDHFPDEQESIFRAELNSDYEFSNTATKERRYQAVYNITYKE